MPQETCVELAILEFDIDADRADHIQWNGQRIMHHCSRTGRDLVVVQGDKNILRITALNALAVAVEQVGVEVIGPWIHVALFIEHAGATDDPVTAAHGDIQPELI
jgi:hypothetical protein